MTREERKDYMRKWRAKHREEYDDRMKKWKYEHKEEYNARKRKYQDEDLNQNGVTKNYIRTKSRGILERCHTKLPGYEIHHCFGYEDPGKFIYIPRELHIKIHQFLRDNNIPAHIEHFNTIRGIIYSYPGYTYIRS